MEISEQYCMYRLAYYFVMEEKYDMLHINNDRNEVWLEKRHKKNTNIIRFIPRGFNWKNHLKNDIARVFQRVKMLKNMFIGQNISIYNIYVTDTEPVDDWEALKKPMILKEKKPVKMNVFYLTEDNFPDEENRLFQKIHANPISEQPLPDEAAQKKDVIYYKTILNDIVQKNRQEIKDTLTFGKLHITYLMIFLNLIMFTMLELQGGSMQSDVLIQFGAKYNPAIADGQWWRLVTSMFLHIGLLHLVLNMIALYYIGAIAERIYGSIRFTFIYLLAGIAGSLSSFAFDTHISAGASGAIFGLFGALLYFGLIHQRLFQQTIGKSIALILIINLGLGFFVPQIDMGAHLGGLLGGFLAASIVSLPRRRYLLWQILSLVGLICIYGGLWWIGG
ncbi:MAG TPA: rhomboid family intramembrane serine protease [Pseudogracilibacillus sp.]|nr:rhomboid family intramembrane serine protease [Pseudogracilibacillus sp.]